MYSIQMILNEIRIESTNNNTKIGDFMNLKNES